MLQIEGVLRCCQRKITRIGSGSKIRFRAYGHIQLGSGIFSHLHVKVPWFEVHGFKSEDVVGSVWGSLSRPPQCLWIPLMVKSISILKEG